MFFVKLFIGFEYGAKNGKNVTGVCNCNDGNGVVLVNSSSEITSLCEKNLSLWCQFWKAKKGVALSLLKSIWVVRNELTFNFFYSEVLAKILFKNYFQNLNIMPTEIIVWQTGVFRAISKKRLWCVDEN